MTTNKERGRGRFLEIKIIDQFNSHDIIFQGKARMDDKKKILELLRLGELRGLEENDNKEYLFKTQKKDEE